MATEREEAVLREYSTPSLRKNELTPAESGTSPSERLWSTADEEHYRRSGEAIRSGTAWAEEVEHHGRR